MSGPLCPEAPTLLHTLSGLREPLTAPRGPSKTCVRLWGGKRQDRGRPGSLICSALITPHRAGLGLEQQGWGCGGEAAGGRSHVLLSRVKPVRGGLGTRGCLQKSRTEMLPFLGPLGTQSGRNCFLISTGRAPDHLEQPKCHPAKRQGLDLGDDRTPPSSRCV